MNFDEWFTRLHNRYIPLLLINIGIRAIKAKQFEWEFKRALRKGNQMTSEQANDYWNDMVKAIDEELPVAIKNLEEALKNQEMTNDERVAAVGMLNSLKSVVNRASISKNLWDANKDTMIQSPALAFFKQTPIRRSNSRRKRSRRTRRSRRRR